MHIMIEHIFEYRTYFMIDKNDEDINSHQSLNLYEWSNIDMK